MLAYTETEYEEKAYDMTIPERSNSPWFTEKLSLGMDFPNLPYYIDGKLKKKLSFKFFLKVLFLLG